MEKSIPCPWCKKVIPTEGDEKHGMVAAFRSESYLSDAQCRQLIIEISKGWRDDSRSWLSRHPIARFRPLSVEEMKQSRDLDAYAVSIDCAGNLIRTHIVKSVGAMFLNPPPSDHHCESCRGVGPLREHFQTSRVDGANVAVWLCSGCETLLPENRGVKF